MKIPANSRIRQLPESRQLAEHRPGELLVGLHAASSSFCPGSWDQLGGEVLHRFRFPENRFAPATEMLHLKLPEGVRPEEAMQALEKDPRVAYTALNHVFDIEDCLVGKTTLPNDLDPKQWGMTAIHAGEAWSATHGSPKTVIAVFDSGIDTNHSDLKANLWTNRKEIPGNGLDDDKNGYVDDIHGIDPHQMNGDVMDKFRHGTHTAGTIGAVGNNGKGVTGVNWETQILAIKIFDKNGKTDAAAIAKGLEYAAQNGARITSHSWGNKVFNSAMLEAFKSSQALHICAAGNKGENNDVLPIYPASFNLDNIVSVANTDKYDNRAARSNYGFNSVDLAAPGTDILSTVPGGGTDLMSGTSMACPHVSGVAGLIVSAFPNATSAEVKERLLCGSDKIDSLTGMLATGGRLNAALALENDRTAPAPITQLSLKKADSRGLNVQWTATGDDGKGGTAALYDLRYSHQPITADNFSQAERVGIHAPKASGSQENARLELRPELKARDLYVALKTFDNVGNASPLATLAAQVPAAQVLFRDQGPASFKVDGQWAQINHPQVGAAWTDSPDGDYQTSQSTSLTTQTFSLAGMKNATAIFDAKLDLDGRDTLWLQGGSDGTTWSAVGRLEGQKDWQPYQVDLSKFAGEKKVQFRFALESDGHGTADGCYLNNIAVLGDSK
ncbi:S8 family serine peptidase [bacterium]|nr:S8 family serine peptidase [bacterium]